MPSRLSSLLVRDALVGVKRMEKAFQRQVIYGGTLDTILLEMNLVTEDRLTQYLALASGLPPAARDEGGARDPAAIEVLSQELAEQYRAVPLSIAGDVVRILVCSPLEITDLEDLADEIDRPLQPLITPEYRWHLVFAAAYGIDPPARYTTLARSLDVDPTLTPVGRARTVIIDEHAAPAPTEEITDATERTELADATTKMPAAAPPGEPPGLPDEPQAVPDEPQLPAISRTPATTRPADWQTPDVPPPRPAPPAVADPEELEPVIDTIVTTPDPAEAITPPSELAREPRERRNTLVGVVARPTGGTDPGPLISPPRRPADGVPEEPVERPHIRFAPGAPTPSTGVPRPIHEAPARPSGSLRRKDRPVTAPIATVGRDHPLPVVRARELLATAEDRDTVFLTLLRAARSRARWAGLLTVQGGAAIGRVAIAEDGLRTEAIHTVLIPLDAASAFRAVVDGHQHYVGSLVSGDPGVDAMVLRLGGTMPPSALLLPIVIRDRVVAIVVAHRQDVDITHAEVTELLPVAIAAAEAIGRLIVKHKSAGYRAPAEPAAVVEIEAENVETKKLARPEGPWSVPAEPPSAPILEHEVDVAIVAEPDRPITEVIDDIERAAEGHAEDALAEAVERPHEAIGEISRRFPGTLRVDRFAVAGRALRASQYGGLLELVIRLGATSAELLIEKMSAAQRDLRYYATVCAGELRPRNAVYALAERLFDQDFGVRATAIDALAGYPIQDLGAALARARRAVHSSDPEVVSAATAALVALGDVDAIVDLVGAVERTDRAGDHARRALIALTAQDFGTSERKWRKWHDGARKKHRVEWLIEGLSHKEDAIRENSINDLRRLTGEYFGYHYDLAKRERELAAERWVHWWRETGHRRFVLREDERLRPTALLPARHEPHDPHDPS